MQLTNGLKENQKGNPFAHLMNRLLGLALPPMRLDEIQIVIRAHTFFKLVQNDWIQKIRTNYKMLEISSDSESNLCTGGDCSIFELLDQMAVAMRKEPYQERILANIKPDILLTKQENRDSMNLEFCVLKITNRIAKSGKSVDAVFKNWLNEDQKTIESTKDIFEGIKKNLGVFFTREDTDAVSMFIDEDCSGDVDIGEFNNKISFKEYQKRSHTFLISEMTFIDRMLSEWYEVRAAEKEKLIEMIT